VKKLFTNDKFFLAMTVLGVLGLIVADILLSINYPGSMTSIITRFIAALCLIFLRSSYVKHSKNVMKGLMGALLMAGLLHSLSLTGSIFLTIDKVFVPIIILLSAVLFISHFIINSDHHSKPGYIRLNQVLCALLAVAFLVWNIGWACVSENAVDALASIALALGRIGMYAAVVCVESRLDAYRIEREANGYKAE